MARLMIKYATPYFAKLFIAGKKTVRYLPKYGGNFQVKKDMCIHRVLDKHMNPNCALYHEQENEMNAQYAENVCTLLSQDMEYIWRHGPAEIQVQSPLESKRNREII